MASPLPLLLVGARRCWASWPPCWPPHNWAIWLSAASSRCHGQELATAGQALVSAHLGEFLVAGRL